jgi:hypothetical protein
MTMATMTKWNGFELRMQADRRKAERSATYRDASNDAPRCPWVYAGFEEPPRFPRSFGGSVCADDLDRRLRAIDGRVMEGREARRHA